jgi:hypothetical protein
MAALFMRIWHSSFCQAEEEFLDGDEVIGLGALGKEGSGRLRVNVSNKQSLSAKAQKKFKLKAYGSGGGTSGLSSSLAFTPIQVRDSLPEVFIYVTTVCVSLPLVSGWAALVVGISGCPTL